MLSDSWRTTTYPDRISHRDHGTSGIRLCQGDVLSVQGQFLIGLTKKAPRVPKRDISFPSNAKLRDHGTYFEFFLIKVSPVRKYECSDLAR
jgi:hypothetical protein